VPYRVLIADDDPYIGLTFSSLFRRQPWEVEVVEQGEEAIRRLTVRSIDIALLDIKMPDLDGLQILQIMQRRRIQTDSVVITGYGTVDLAVEAMKLGARDFVEKPVDLSVLLSKVTGIMQKRHPARSSLARRLDSYLRGHLGQPALSLRHLSFEFGISERYVCRQFRDGFETTFRARLNRHRIDAAKRFIESSNASMSRVAESCGYRNQRRFCEAFRRLEGVTPRSYRYSLVLGEDAG